MRLLLTKSQEISSWCLSFIGLVMAANICTAILPNSVSAQVIIDHQNINVRDEADRLFSLGKFQLYQGQPQKAIASWQKAINTYRLVNDQAAIARTLSIMGITYGELGRQDEAGETFRLRLGYANTLNEPLGKLATTNNLATTALQEADRPNAENYNRNGLKLSRQYEHHQGTAIALNTSAQLATKRGDYLRAIKIYYQSLPYRYPIRDLKGEAYTYLLRGDNFMALQEYKKAIQDYGLALLLSKQTQDSKLLALATDRLVAPYLELPNYYRVEELLKQKIELATQANDLASALVAQQQLGDLYVSLNRLDKAQLAYEQSLEIAAKLRDRLAIQESYLRLQTLKRL